MSKIEAEDRGRWSSTMTSMNLKVAKEPAARIVTNKEHENNTQ